MKILRKWNNETQWHETTEPIYLSDLVGNGYMTEENALSIIKKRSFIVGKFSTYKLKTEKVELEIYPNTKGDLIIFNIVFVDTGEIRQKRKLKEWVMKRIFQSELKTRRNKYDEFLELEE